MGSYAEKTRTLCLSKTNLSDRSSAKKTIFHEMIHWIHDHNPKISTHVKQLWDQRIQGETIRPLAPWNKESISGFPDHFKDATGSEYGGRVYPWESGNTAKGLEVLTTHLEKIANPEELKTHWSFAADDGKYYWREAFIQLLQNLYE